VSACRVGWRTPENQAVEVVTASRPGAPWTPRTGPAALGSRRIGAAGWERRPIGRLVVEDNGRGDSFGGFLRDPALRTLDAATASPPALRSSVFALFVVPFIGAVTYWKGVRYFLYFLPMILSAVLAALDWRRRHLPDLPFLAGALPLRVAGIQTLRSERPARGRVMAAWGIPWIARGSRSSAR